MYREVFVSRSNFRATPLRRRRRRGFSKDRSRRRAAETFPSRAAPNFSAQKRPRIHLCRATTTRNWLDSRRSFADVTTRKRKNKTINGRRGARREGGTEQESERRRGRGRERDILARIFTRSRARRTPTQKSLLLAILCVSHACVA